MKRVLVSGSFDVLHIGHIRLLQFARSCGTHLTVFLDSSERIARKKGSSRPFNSLSYRKEFLQALGMVSEVKAFDCDDQLIEGIKKADVVVIGSDWKDGDIVGKEFIKELKFFDRIEGFSTTAILEGK